MCFLFLRAGVGSPRLRLNHFSCGSSPVSRSRFFFSWSSILLSAHQVQNSSPGSRSRTVSPVAFCPPLGVVLPAGARQGHVFSPAAVVRAQCLIFTGSSKCGLSSKSLVCVIYFLSSSRWFHRPCATRLFSSSSVVAPACVQSLPLTISNLILVRSRVRVYELLQELVPIFVLSHRIKRLKDLWFKLLSRGNFLNTPTRCSVKCLRGYKTVFLSRFLSSISHVILLALFRVFAAVPSPVPKADSLSIVRRS
jgi:hypothetical protein